jgi:hypothetical protein
VRAAAIEAIRPVRKCDRPKRVGLGMPPAHHWLPGSRNGMSGMAMADVVRLGTGWPKGVSAKGCSSPIGRVISCAWDT